MLTQPHARVNATKVAQPHHSVLYYQDREQGTGNREQEEMQGALNAAYSILGSFALWFSVLSSQFLVLSSLPCKHFSLSISGYEQV
jgi:hypothetical protein